MDVYELQDIICNDRERSSQRACLFNRETVDRAVVHRTDAVQPSISRKLPVDVSRDEVFD